MHHHLPNNFGNRWGQKEFKKEKESLARWGQWGQKEFSQPLIVQTLLLMREVCNFHHTL